MKQENEKFENKTIKTRSSIEEQLVNFMHIAILAPSGHNTQPWRFKATTTYVEIFADRSRRLPVVDPNDRELTISCGAAIGFFEIAARRSGYDANVTYNEDEDQPDLLARLELKKGSSPTTEETTLFNAISKRTTNRNSYSMRPVLDNDLDKCKDISQDFDVYLSITETEAEREAIAELVSQGDKIQFENSSFRKELAHWVRSSSLGNKDGMSGENFGMPDILSPVGQFVIRTFDIGNGVAADDKKKIVSASPVLAIFGTSDDSQKSWIDTGRALAHVLLHLTSCDLASSYLNQPIEVKTLRHKLKIATNMKSQPQILIRVGYSEHTLSPTVRRELEDVLIA